MAYDVSMPAEWDADNSQVAMEVGEKIGPVFPLKPDTKKPSITGGFYAGKRRKRDILEMAATRPKHLWALATGLLPASWSSTPTRTKPTPTWKIGSVNRT
jgi:hypothetical protein